MAINLINSVAYLSEPPAAKLQGRGNQFQKALNTATEKVGIKIAESSLEGAHGVEQNVEVEVVAQILSDAFREYSAADGEEEDVMQILAQEQWLSPCREIARRLYEPLNNNLTTKPYAESETKNRQNVERGLD